MNYFNMDSFGDTCPGNWEEIAAWLNNTLELYCPNFDPDNWEDRDFANKLWEDFASGDLYAVGCPRPLGLDTHICTCV